MRRTVKPPPAGAAWRSYTFRPPDPVWASRSELERLRARLRAHDPALNVWWSAARSTPMDPRRGRWRVVAWSPSSANWITVTYVEDHLGRYLPPCPAEPIVRRVQELEWNGRRNLEAMVEERNERIRSAKQQELLDGVKEWMEDFHARHEGVRQTFGPGYIRRRAVKVQDIRNASHQRWLRETMGLEFGRVGERARFRPDRGAPIE